jgi:hypothetical protein
MKNLLRGLVILLLMIVAVPLGIVMFIRSRIRWKPKPPKPVTEADFLKAENKLGFSLPDDLRRFFTPPRPKCRVDCASPYTLGEAVREYRMVTKRPYGPNGQDWPRELFPFADLMPGYGCYDLETGLVTEWDPEDLGGDDDRPILWDRSFNKTGKTLGQWLAGEDKKAA